MEWVRTNKAEEILEIVQNELLTEFAHLQFALKSFPGIVQEHGQNASHGKNTSNDWATICGKVAKGAEV